MKDCGVLNPAGQQVSKQPASALTRVADLRHKAFFPIGGFRQKRSTAGVGQELSFALAAGPVGTSHERSLACARRLAATSAKLTPIAVQNPPPR